MQHKKGAQQEWFGQCLEEPSVEDLADPAVSAVLAGLAD